MTRWMPSFIIGGATASGTTFLSQLLRQHPDIYLPASDGTEPHFFSMPHRFNRGFSWYRQWFDGVQHECCVGERSSSYLHFPEAAVRIKQWLPEVKLIFVLRDPVSRSWAHYRYMVLRGIETMDFQAALAAEVARRNDQATDANRARHFDYIQRSLYGQQLQEYLKTFSAKQICLISSKKLKECLRTELRKITDFLCVSPLEHYRLPGDYPSVSVLDPYTQQAVRAYFGIEKSRELIEAIRCGGDFDQFIESEEDLAQLHKLRNNLCTEKKPLDDALRQYIEPFFEHDRRLFFSITKNLIDQEGWF
jgi:hypothetical protein